MTCSETKYIVSKVKYIMSVTNVPPGYNFFTKYHIPLYLTFALKCGAGVYILVVPPLSKECIKINQQNLPF